MNRTTRLPRLSSPLAVSALLAVFTFAACDVASDPPETPVGSISKSVASAAASAPSLGSAAPFAVLAASTVTCTNLSAVSGDLGVSPGTAITGFNPDCAVTGTIHAGDAVAAQAHADAVTAYNGLQAAACDHNLTGQDLGNQTLVPGVYCFDSSVGLTGQLTLDGAGNGDAVWIFQIGSTLTTASSSSVVIVGSGQPCNVFWQVGSSATLGTGTAFQGNILALASITLTTGSNVIGRALALNAAVTMDHNNVSPGNCTQSGGTGGTGGAAGMGGAAGTGAGGAGGSIGTGGVSGAGGSSGSAGAGGAGATGAGGSSAGTGGASGASGAGGKGGMGGAAGKGGAGGAFCAGKPAPVYAPARRNPVTRYGHSGY